MAELLDRLQAALGTTYRIERELPGGGMSRVFLATEVRLNRSVVVKVLPPDMAMAVQSERFEREIQVAASLQHPHIVSLLTAGSHDDLAWYVMPFIEGESLASKLEREGALPVHEALRILRDVLDALTYSPSRGVVHRDIKPDNVMLSGRHALVTDFGVSKAVSASSGGKGGLTTVGIALGTPTYMAPEQAAADPHVDHRADLYAVGVMAYELLTGRTPFLATTPQAMLAAHVTAYPDPITHHRPSLPPMVAAAVMRCLEKLPADRWQTSSELAAVIEAASTPSGGLTPVPTGVTGAFGSGAEGALRRARPLRVAGLFALATVVVVAVVFGATRVFGLPDWVWVGSAALMAIGFPIVMYTGRVERKRARATIAGMPTSGAAKAHHQWFTWRRAILGGAVALGALVFAAAGYAAARALGIGPAGTLLSSGVVGAEDRFVLADFQNRTADSSLGTSVTEALRVDLGQSQVVKILSDREVAGALTRMTLRSGAPLGDSLALVLAQREGAKAVIVGEVSTLGTGYVLTAKVLEATTGETRASVRATAKDAGELLGALNDLSGQLRERIGESLRTIRASEPLEQVTTSSLEALQHYSLGTRVFVAGDYDGAKQHMEGAIAIDSNFAMAYRKLGAILTNLNAPRSQIAAVTRKAYELRDRLTPVERYLTEAAYYRNVEPDPDRVIGAYQAVLAINPYDVTAANNIAMALNSRDRPAEAEAALRPVVARTPTRTLYVNLATALATQGTFAAIDSLSEDAARRIENPGAI
ncbi:MAG TPA: protein kinase, partial [Gemmatimonadales bacterium]|nr:protein kinase [Gemmatimonadales bacterium]